MPRRRKVVKRQNKKAVRKVKKLAKVKNKKVARKPRAISKVKRTIKKRYKTPSNKRVLKKAGQVSKKLTKKLINQLIKSTESFEIEGSTNKQLKKYIEDAVKLINESARTMNRSSKLAYKEAMRLFGEENGLLSSDTAGDKKLDLIEKARVLQSIQDGDGVSNIALIRKNMKTLKAFKSFKRGAYGRNIEGLTVDEYNQMVREAGRVESLLGNYYNDDMFDYFHMYKDTLGMKTIGDIMVKTVKKHKGEGLTEDMMDKYVRLAIKDAFRKKYD